jgi:hypothetical protein
VKLRFHCAVKTAITGAPDLNTDGKSDALARDSSGLLWFFPGTEEFDDDGKADLLARDRRGVQSWSVRSNGKGAFPTRTKVSSGWNPMTAITQGEDRERGGRADLLVRDRNGVLWFYPLNGRGELGPRTRIGAGWNVMTSIS